jgi:NAD(P)-dependent dehydrogenase (short-subunit alcohol dehydrogenase family)
MFERDGTYTAFAAYGRSKLANLLFTFELQRRLESSGSGTLSLAAHPGLAFTNLADHLQDNRIFRAAGPLLKLLGQSARTGTLPSLRAACDPEAQGGEYYGPGGFAQLKGPPAAVRPAASARDPEVAYALWERSEELTGLRYLS